MSEGALRALEHTAPQRNNLLTVRCDVRQDAAQAAAFQRHMARWKRLDVALLNAGVGETGALLVAAALQAKQLRAALCSTACAERSPPWVARC